MSWSGGSYTKGNAATGGWAGDASLGIGIEASRHDTQDNDFATGINQCVNKDGSNAFTGNPNLGGYIPTNLGAGTAGAPALCVGNDVNTGVFGPAADTWAVATNGSERVRVDSTGNVGVGTTSPTALLDVRGLVSSKSQTASGIINIESAQYSADAAGTIFQTIKSRGATVGSNGAVSSGDFIFSLNNYANSGSGNIRASYISAIVDTGTISASSMPGALLFATTPSGSTVTSERMRITNGGFVFINTTSNFSADKMCLAFGTSENGLGVRDNNDTSGATFAVFRNSTNGICGSVTRVTTTNAVNYNTSSDYRLKKDIKPIQNSLLKVADLNPVTFVWKDCNIAASGFIAHELQEVLPDAVTGEKDAVDASNEPIYQQVDYAKLTPLLAAAIKELNAKVEALEAQVEMLQTQVALA